MGEGNMVSITLGERDGDPVQRVDFLAAHVVVLGNLIERDQRRRGGVGLRHGGGLGGGHRPGLSPIGGLLLPVAVVSPDRPPAAATKEKVLFSVPWGDFSTATIDERPCHLPDYFNS